MRVLGPIPAQAGATVLPTPRYLVVVAHRFVGDRHCVAHPNAVALPFTVVLAWGDGCTPSAMFVTIQQRVLAVDDDVYAGSIGVGFPPCGAIYNGTHYAWTLAADVCGLS